MFHTAFRTCIMAVSLIGVALVLGVFTPMIFVGAAMGYPIRLLAGQLAPGIASAPLAYAIAGMGATLAAAVDLHRALTREYFYSY
nr:chloride channel protein [Herbaspirillum frisingense]